MGDGIGTEYGRSGRSASESSPAAGAGHAKHVMRALQSKIADLQRMQPRLTSALEESTDRFEYTNKVDDSSLNCQGNTSFGDQDRWSRGEGTQQHKERLLALRKKINSCRRSPTASTDSISRDNSWVVPPKHPALVSQSVVVPRSPSRSKDKYDNIPANVSTGSPSKRPLSLPTRGWGNLARREKSGRHDPLAPTWDRPNVEGCGSSRPQSLEATEDDDAGTAAAALGGGIERPRSSVFFGSRYDEATSELSAAEQRVAPVPRRASSSTRRQPSPSAGGRVRISHIARGRLATMAHGSSGLPRAASATEPRPASARFAGRPHSWPPAPQFGSNASASRDANSLGVRTFSPVTTGALNRWRSRSPPMPARGSNDPVTAMEESRGLESAGRSKIAVQDEKIRPTPPPVWVTRHVGYLKKFGVGFELSDGTVGVLFSDGTTMVLDPTGKGFDYVNYPSGKESLAEKGEKRGGGDAPSWEEPVRTRYNMKFFPLYLTKKVAILKHFRNHLDETSDGSPAIAERAVSTDEALAGGRAAAWPGIGGQQLVPSTSSRPPLVLVEKWQRRRRTSAFFLSDKTVQVIFNDRTEILLSDNARVVTFVGKDGTRGTLPLQESLRRKRIMKRIRHAKDMLFQPIHRSPAV